MADGALSWWYEQNGQQAGPVTAGAIQGMLASGQLTPAHRVWRDGLAGWTPVGHVPELQPVAPPPPAFAAPAPPPASGEPQHPAGHAPPYAPAAAPAAPFAEISVAGVILLSVVTLGIYGLVKFYATGQAYERFAGRKSNFTLYFWLFIGCAVGAGVFPPVGIAGLVFQVLTLFEALALRDDGMRRWNVQAQVTSASTHKTFFILGIVFAVVFVGVVFAILQAVKWFQDWNAIGRASQGRLA